MIITDFVHLYPEGISLHHMESKVFRVPKGAKSKSR